MLQVSAVVTLGAPHSPPPAGAGRDVTGGALSYVHKNFPGTPADSFVLIAAHGKRCTAWLSAAPSRRCWDRCSFQRQGHPLHLLQWPCGPRRPESASQLCAAVLVRVLSAGTSTCICGCRARCAAVGQTAGLRAGLWTGPGRGRRRGCPQQERVPGGKPIASPSRPACRSSVAGLTPRLPCQGADNLLLDGCLHSMAKVGTWSGFSDHVWCAQTLMLAPCKGNVCLTKPVARCRYGTSGAIDIWLERLVTA